MNYWRIALVGWGATVVYLALGFLVFALSPLADEFWHFPAVYRTPESMKGAAPLGMLGMFLAMLALATLYALAYRNRSRIAEGLRLVSSWECSQLGLSCFITM